MHNESNDGSQGPRTNRRIHPDPFREQSQGARDQTITGVGTITEDLELSELQYFTCTEAYHKIMNVDCTDGIMYLMNNGHAWVVTDAICQLRSSGALKGEEFVTIKLMIQNHKAIMEYSDGNGNVIIMQKYGYTDSEASSVKMFYTNNVLMLAGEY